MLHFGRRHGTPEGLWQKSGENAHRGLARLKRIVARLHAEQPVMQRPLLAGNFGGALLHRDNRNMRRRLARDARQPMGAALEMHLRGQSVSTTPAAPPRRAAPGVMPSSLPVFS